MQHQVLAGALDHHNGLGRHPRVKYHETGVCIGTKGFYSQTPVGCYILDFELPGKIIIKKSLDKSKGGKVH